MNLPQIDSLICKIPLQFLRSERKRETLPMIESVMAVRIATGFYSPATLLQHRPSQSMEESMSCFHYAPRRVFQPQRLNNIARSGVLKYSSDYFSRKHSRKNHRTQATSEYVDAASDPEKQTGKSKYHPSEDIRGSFPQQNTGDSRLSPAETTRTIIEVNNKGTLMLTGSIGDGVHENILWPDIPYITDQNGNLYFQVKEDEDVMQSVTSDNNYVQVIVGFDTMEMIKEMELMGLSDSDYDDEDDGSEGEEDDEEDGDEEGDDDEEEWVAVLEDEDEDDTDDSDDDEDDSDSDESLGDWANLETMRSCHPMFFAKRMTEVASNDPVDWMDQPSVGLAIQGLLSHILVEDYSDIQKKLADSKYAITNEINDAEDLQEKLESVVDKANGDESEKTRNVVAFYKLEMIRIQLITAQGDQTEVEVEDVRKATPDAVAHASAGIISRLEESGDKLTEAIKSLCWRHNAIQAEEVKLIGIDSLGFDLRLCAGAKIESLRFAFSTRATSEDDAEGQIRELLFRTAKPV